MNKSYFVLALLCLGANSCQDSSIKASDVQLAGMQKPCVEPSHYNIEVENPNYLFSEPLRFRIPADHNVKLSYEQNAQQKTNTPPDIFCTQSEMRFLKVKTLKLSLTQSRSGSITKGEKSKTLKGVYNITLPSRHNLRCSKTPGTSKTNHFRFAYVAAETCRMLSTLPDSNLNFNYYIQTYPPDHVNGGSQETENWPYKFYPRETWSMLEEDITTYLSNLLYEDPSRAN